MWEKLWTQRSGQEPWRWIARYPCLLTLLWIARYPCLLSSEYPSLRLFRMVENWIGKKIIHVCAWLGTPTQRGCKPRYTGRGYTSCHQGQVSTGPSFLPNRTNNQSRWTQRHSFIICVKIRLVIMWLLSMDQIPWEICSFWHRFVF